MRMSKLHVPTLKEDPADAEVISHRLMLRAGMIRKLTAGVYSYLPLGYRSLRKVEDMQFPGLGKKKRSPLDSRGGFVIFSS